MTTIEILLLAIVILNVLRLFLAIRQARKIDKIETVERQDQDSFLEELGVFNGSDR